jgi:hypothetical protein
MMSQQMGNNKGASQAGMTGYGTGRQIIDDQSEARKGQTDYKNSSLQMGTNAGASQAGQVAPGTRFVPSASRTHFLLSLRQELFEACW